ncbi:MAG: hypothetical protein Q4D33_07290 [Prevotellaceae bacterium]|nr:hypothetical protein [Prevotellaceae bacterium]
MFKTTIYSVDLNTAMQDTPHIDIGRCYPGILSRTDTDQFVFQETVRKERRVTHRNPKLYEGNYISLVRKLNGSYQCHLRTMPDLTTVDRSKLAFNIYSEILDALEVVE